MDLRFVGDIPLLPGALLAILAAVGAWWMYRREVRRGASRGIALVLPGLRAMVVLMLLLMLTGPVLHHRQVIGQLGRVLIFVDGSESMAVGDAHMTVDRKLLTAASRGWIPDGAFDVALAEVADSLGEARRTAAEARRPTQSAAELRQAITRFEAHVQQANAALGEAAPRQMVDEPKPQGSILREWWLELGGSDLAGADAAFDAEPDGHDAVEQFAAPQNWGDNYAQRLRGYVHPPASGSYRFWVASDDQSELYLSTDAEPDNARRIAHVQSHTQPGDWPDGDARSEPIALEAGQRYYIEVRHKEGSGEDHVGVGWQLPDATMQRPIPGEHLSPARRSGDDATLSFDQLLAEFSGELVSPAVALAGRDIESADDAEQARQALLNLGTLADRYEATVRLAFQSYAAEVAETGGGAIQRAIAQFDGMSRWQRVEALLLAEERGLLDQLAGNHHVELLTLDGSEVHRLWASGEATDQPRAFTAEAVAARTDLTSGAQSRVGRLRDGLRRTADEAGEDTDDDVTVVPVADASTDAAEPAEERTAVLIISDGQHNDGPSPLQLATRLNAQQMPLFTVGVGSTVPAADLAVMDVVHPENVFRDDRVQGEIIFMDHMPAGQTFKARVEHGGQVVWEQELTTQNSGRRRIAFDVAVEPMMERELEAVDDPNVEFHSMPLSLSASVGPIEGERRADNNAEAFHFSAISGAYRVLLVDGRARWETRYLRNLFERDSRWEVTTAIAGPSAERSTLTRGEGRHAFPADRESLFDYDLVIFGELPAALLEEAEMEHLRHFVQNRGGGLIFVDGQREHLREYVETPIGPLLPVAWDESGIDDRLPTRLTLTQTGRERSALRLSGDLGHRELWEALPPPHWAAPVSVTAGAGEVLVEAVYDEDQRVPVMVEQRFGAGRVLYLGSDESWRWRHEVADLYHQRFWHQLAGYVMESPYQVSDQFVSIDTGAVVHQPGGSRAVRVRLRDDEGRPVLQATAELVLWRGDQQVATIDLQADENQGGVFRGSTPALEPGSYDASVRVTGVPDEQLRARAHFVVQGDEFGERATLTLHEELLRQMSDASAGRYLREEDAARLPELLEPLSAGRVIESDTALWQSYWWFSAMIGLLTVEWLLRKRTGML
ncbi:MAG: PA14 domain-containing protein [Phycisphaeraceae bacterium]